MDYYVQMTDSKSLVEKKKEFVSGYDKNLEWKFEEMMRKYLFEECKSLATFIKIILDLAFETHSMLNLTYNDNKEFASVFTESTWQSYLYQLMLRHVFTRYEIYSVPFSESGAPTHNCGPEEYHFTKASI